MRVLALGVAAAILATTAISALARAQTGRTTADGVYTEGQAERGKTLYFEQCVTCHGDRLQGGESAPGFAGGEFAKWPGTPVGILFDFINTQMPVGRPGFQGAGGSAALVAYILSQNGQPAGQTELPADSAALQDITIAAAKP